MHFVCKIQWSHSPCSNEGPRNGSAAMEILTKSNCCYICVQGHHCNRWTDLPWNIPCLWIPVLYLSHRFLGTVFKLISQQWNRADLLRYFVLGKLPDFFHCFLKNRKKSDRILVRPVSMTTFYIIYFTFWKAKVSYFVLNNSHKFFIRRFTVLMFYVLSWIIFTVRSFVRQNSI